MVVFIIFFLLKFVVFIKVLEIIEVLGVVEGFEFELGDEIIDEDVLYEVSKRFGI